MKRQNANRTEPPIMRWWLGIRGAAQTWLEKKKRGDRRVQVSSVVQLACEQPEREDKHDLHATDPAAQTDVDIAVHEDR